MIENALVHSLWKRFAFQWWFNVILSSSAIVILTLAPVANPEWPYLLGFLWVFYLFFGVIEVRDYFDKREAYLKLRFTETPTYIKEWYGV
jgi:hypothetical protein